MESASSRRKIEFNTDEYRWHSSYSSRFFITLCLSIDTTSAPVFVPAFANASARIHLPALFIAASTLLTPALAWSRHSLNSFSPSSTLPCSVSTPDFVSTFSTRIWRGGTQCDRAPTDGRVGSRDGSSIVPSFEGGLFSLFAFASAKPSRSVGVYTYCSRYSGRIRDGSSTEYSSVSESYTHPSPSPTYTRHSRRKRSVDVPAASFDLSDSSVQQRENTTGKRTAADLRKISSKSSPLLSTSLSPLPLPLPAAAALIHAFFCVFVYSLALAFFMSLSFFIFLFLFCFRYIVSHTRT
mmetsp:Transcript_18839/g.47867  ORF Transcript_18839/g.47867 Transcript_18839/m.47867 type:complete len:296 (-) Transcript_18839:3978-4865(-)